MFVYMWVQYYFLSLIIYACKLGGWYPGRVNYRFKNV